MPAMAEEPAQPVQVGNREPVNDVVLANPVLGARRLTGNYPVTGIS